MNDRRDEHRGRDLYRRLRMESGIPRRLDAASLPAHASDQRRTRLLLRIGPWLQVLQPVDARRGRAVVATTNFSGTRSYGTSVLLPLSPSNGYASRVMIFGGGNPATNTTEIIDLSAATPQWQWRTADVAGAHRDERDHPAQRQSAGDGRIGQR